MLSVDVLSVVLVVAGVVGELLVGVVSYNKDGLLRSKNTERIELVRQQANEATLQAGNARDSAVQAQGAASIAGRASREAKQDAREVKGGLQSAVGELTTLKSDSKDLSYKADKIKTDLLNLAICNSPRVIPNWMTGGKSTADPLRTLSGQKIVIEFIPDAEARRAALNLASVLLDAKWDVQIPLGVVDELRDGVSVQPSMAGTDPVNGQLPNLAPYWHATDVAERLVIFLHSYNWQAERGWPSAAPGKLLRDPSVLPAGAVRVQIGLYPPVTYVSPPGQHELTAWMEQFNRERLKFEVEAKRKREEQQSQYLSQLPPEVRQRVIAQEAEMQARSEASTAAYTQPCQVLNPLNPPVR